MTQQSGEDQNQRKTRIPYSPNTMNVQKCVIGDNGAKTSTTYKVPQSAIDTCGTMTTGPQMECTGKARQTDFS